MAAAQMSCPDYQNQWNLYDLDSEGNKASPFADADDGANSDVSTEMGSYNSESSQSVDAYSLAGPVPCENLVIFDWDDTLFPTTWLREQGLLEEGALISEEQDASLQALADLVAATLRAAKRRGGVSIVTNAEQGWVELSCSTFMPSLEAELADVRIVSARTEHEKHGMFAPTTWKCLAFSQVVAEFYGAPSDTGAAVLRRNVISLGDSEHEMEALKWVATDAACRAKSLKFVQRPCLEQLMDQHELVASCLDDVVDHDGNLDYEVGVEDS